MKFLLLGLSAFVLVGCRTIQVIPGTGLPDTPINRQIIEVCEDYRRALEERDPVKLLALAHHNYFEDSGTPNANDDYGYDGLKQVLTTRLQQLRSLRYNIEYRHISVIGSHALVDIRYDASFQMATAIGDRWERKENDKRLELEHDGNRWLIVSGM